MATETIVTLVDDLDGSKAAETVSFALDGASFEIDLSKGNASALRKSLSEFVAAARSVKSSSPFVSSSRGARVAKPKAAVASSLAKSDRSEIRAWAQASGITIGDRGRIAAEIVEQFEAAKKGGSESSAPAAPVAEAEAEPAAAPKTRAPRKPKAKVEETPADKPSLKDIRIWANESGIAVSERGRISGDVIRQYEESHA